MPALTRKRACHYFIKKLVVFFNSPNALTSFRALTNYLKSSAISEAEKVIPCDKVTFI